MFLIDLVRCCGCSVVSFSRARNGHLNTISWCLIWMELVDEFEDLFSAQAKLERYLVRCKTSGLQKPGRLRIVLRSEIVQTLEVSQAPTAKTCLS